MARPNDRLDMAVAVNWDVKPQTKTNRVDDMENVFIDLVPYQK